MREWMLQPPACADTEHVHSPQSCSDMWAVVQGDQASASSLALTMHL